MLVGVATLNLAFTGPPCREPFISGVRPQGKDNIMILDGTIQPSTHPGPLSLPLTKSGNWSRTLIAHVFVAHMIAELDYGLGGHFKGRFVAKNSNTTPEWRQRVWMYVLYY